MATQFPRADAAVAQPSTLGHCTHVSKRFSSTTTHLLRHSTYGLFRQTVTC